MVTTLPPSSGSTGSRLNSPIAGPAHQTAWVAAELLPARRVERVDAHQRRARERRQ